MSQEPIIIDPSLIDPRQALRGRTARSLATATVTVPQNAETTTRWLLRLLPWVNLDGGVFRVNRRKQIVPKDGRVVSLVDGDHHRVAPSSLRSILHFRDLEPAALDQLAGQFSGERYEAGAVIANEGDALNRLLVVVKGKLEVSITGPHGDRLTQELLSDGAFYGEDSLIAKEQKIPTIKALTASHLLVLERAKFDETLGRIDGARETIGHTLERYEAAVAQAEESGERRIDLLTAHGGEPLLPSTYVDYEDHPREYHLSRIQTVLKTHTRVTDLYSNKIDQLREQIRLTVTAVKEREEWELLNNPSFGLLHEVPSSQRIPTRTGPPTPDDLDELLTLVWKKPAFFLAHPKAIAAFGRECTRRGVPPPTINIFGSPFLTWRGVPLIPSDKLQINGKSDVAGGLGSTSILLLRVGEAEQGVVGLQKVGVTGEVEPGLSVRYMGTNETSVASHLVTRYFSAAVLNGDAIARLDHVLVGRYHDYVYPTA